jgi:hypothetical protein
VLWAASDYVAHFAKSIQNIAFKNGKVQAGGAAPSFMKKCRKNGGL